MKRNHVNLCVNDVASLSGILARHSGFTVQQTGTVPLQAGATAVAGTEFAVLSGSDGFSLVITGIGVTSPQTYPIRFRVGFVAETAEQVRAKHAEVTEADRRPGPLKSFEAMGAAWTAFYCAVGDDIEIELSARA